MKKYKLTVYSEDCVCTTKIITAKDYDEAKSIAWEIFPEYESVYVSEVE